MILDQILATKRDEVDALDAADLEARVADAPPPRDFCAALRRGPGVPVRAIAEFKRASPSAGVIRAGADPAAIAAEYQAAGAAAISVLTDERFFGGSLADLVTVRARVQIPVLRKDFVVDPVQVLEARAHGADAILVIVRAVDDQRLADLIAAARHLGMAALVEAHDEEEADRAIAAGAEIIGVNHRNLDTLSMNMALFASVAPRLPPTAITVAESGIRAREDVARLAAAGAHAVLVGESLMRQPSPGAALAGLLA
jgi:indole-3-glycerol phosphate synthase